MRNLRPTPAMLVAIIAVVLATAGGAVAASQLIDGRQIKKGTISAGKLTKAAKKQLRGHRGPKGATGAQGEAGPVGPKGDKGDTGATGATGAQGEKGETGAKGDKGDTGETGAQGPKGDKGDTGEKGDTGDTGPQGPEGPEGEKGEKGDKGDKGDKGEKGDPGTDAQVVLYSEGIGGRVPVSEGLDDATYMLNGDVRTALTIPAGTYWLDAAVSTIAPTTGTPGTLVSRIRCNLVNATLEATLAPEDKTNASVDTFYVTFHNVTDTSTPGFRQGLHLGGAVTLHEQATIEVRCFGINGTSTQPGEIGAARINAMQLGSTHGSL